MSGRPVRVVIVDDSALYRGMLSKILSRDPAIEVVGTASDPHDARTKIKALDPDVITLDIEMPGMDGITFLEKIMRLRPMPVVMVSSLTTAGAEATLRALEIGAVDVYGKPGAGSIGGLDADAALLCEKVRTAATARVRTDRAQQMGRETRTTSTASLASSNAATAVPSTGRRGNEEIVAIGASTGGVEALLTVLEGFPTDCPPTVITQHMPGSFTKSFAARLDRLVAPTVVEAAAGDALRVGHVYIAPGGANHLTVVRKAGGLEAALVASDLVSGHRPSVDVLFESVASVVGKRSVGVILTGMGRDGAAGLAAMRAAGARTIGQDEDTSVVYGMPRVAYESGAVETQVPLGRIASAILGPKG